jgi:hypothetical protein
LPGTRPRSGWVWQPRMDIRVAVRRCSPAASWLCRSEEARPWTGPPRGLVEVRGELLTLFYWRPLREVLEAGSASACRQRPGYSRAALARRSSGPGKVQSVERLVAQRGSDGFRRRPRGEGNAAANRSWRVLGEVVGDRTWREAGLACVRRGGAAAARCHPLVTCRNNHKDTKNTKDTKKAREEQERGRSPISAFPYLLPLCSLCPSCLRGCFAAPSYCTVTRNASASECDQASGVCSQGVEPV